jgi:hypothetical protein
MFDKTSHNRKRIRRVYWTCDKKGCNISNNRELRQYETINDDICDYCHCRIHEPLLIDLKND